MNRMFYNDATLNEFEGNKQWRESVEYLIAKLNETFDKHVYFRLAAQCWYTLTFWDCGFSIDASTDKEYFQIVMEKTYGMAEDYGLWNDSDFLWLFGYFMVINQFDFLFISDDVFEIDSKGRTMINSAYKMSPKNCIAKLLYFSDKREYYNLKKELKESINELFSNETEIDRYFVEVFTT